MRPARDPGAGRDRGMVHAVAQERQKVGNRNPINTELMATKLMGRVEAWQRGQSQRAAADAKQRRFARDQRINSLIAWMRELERDDIEADARAVGEDFIRTADLGEIAEARRVIAAQATRAG